MQAGNTIALLKEELAAVYEELSLEQRSRKKSNESLIVLSQQLVALQEKCNNLSSNETDHLLVAVVTSQEDKVPIHSNETPSEVQATTLSPKTPVPTEITKTCEKQLADKQLDDTKERLLVYYNARIQELTTKIPNAQASQKQSMNQHLKLCIESKAMVEKLHGLRHISSKIAAHISHLQTNADRNAVSHKDAISKLSASVKKAKEMDDTPIAEKQDKIKVYAEKIFELEKASQLSNTSDIQALKTAFQEHDALLPNKNQMLAYHTVSKKLRRLKAKHAKLNRIGADFKRIKLQVTLEQALAEGRRFHEKVDMHASIIEQAEQMNQELEAFLEE